MTDWLKFVALGGALWGATAAGALEEVPAVPSNHSLSLLDERIEEQGTLKVMRVRYVMPAIGENAHRFEDVAQDFEHLCTAHVVPLAKAKGEKVDQIIITLSDAETEFGVSNPDVTQYFEAFNLETDICIWEGF